MPTVNTPGLSLQRSVAYINRLPLFTRLIVVAIVAFEVLAVAVRSWWDVRAWGALAPDELGLASRTCCVDWGGCSRETERLTLGGCAVYRTNTYPLVHSSVFHLVVNLLAVVPMLDMFEREYGTLTTLALFLGRESAVTLE